MARSAIRTAGFTAFVAFAVVSGVHALAVQPRAPRASDTFWQQFRVEAVEAVHFDSLSEMADASQLTVTGRVAASKLARQWVAVEEWGDDGIASYVELSIRVGQVLKGDAWTQGDGDLRLQLFVSSPAAVQRVLAANIPDDQVLLFLQPRDDAPGTFKLVSSQGCITELDGNAVPAVSEEEWIALPADQSFDALVTKVDATSND